VIEVRRIRPDDWQALRATRLAALTDSPSAFGSTIERELAFPDAEWQERASLGAVNDDRATFLALDGDDVVGIAGGFEWEGTLDLVSMWTSPAVRRQGVGRRLVEAVLEWAGDRDINLWVTRGNDPAHELYLDMGFVDTDEVQPLPSDPCKDELRMVRRPG
jgi:GNAT superfamily N-acetyltransferase